MLQFLSHIPSYEPQETDSLSQMETKLKNQKVGWLPLCSRPAAARGAWGTWEVGRPTHGGEQGSGCHLPWWKKGKGLAELCLQGARPSLPSSM